MVNEGKKQLLSLPDDANEHTEGIESANFEVAHWQYTQSCAETDPPVFSGSTCVLEKFGMSP